MTTVASPEYSTATLQGRVASLAGVVSHAQYSKQDRAALKRWAPGHAPPLAFYRLWLRHCDEELPAPGQIENWMLLAWALATMGDASHGHGMPVGTALARSGYPEARLERLLSAPEELRPDLFTSLIRFLAAKGQGFDWKEIAHFIFIRDPDKREAVHGQIAAAFYRTQFQLEKE